MGDVVSIRKGPAAAAAPGKYKVQVIADSSGTWAGNGLRFHCVTEAAAHARDLAGRWRLVTRWRVVDDDGTEYQRS
jgi:hypothetical protein